MLVTDVPRVALFRPNGSAHGRRVFAFGKGVVGGFCLGPRVQQKWGLQGKPAFVTYVPLGASHSQVGGKLCCLPLLVLFVSGKRSPGPRFQPLSLPSGSEQRYENGMSP